jgi:hypothetical protein
VQEAVRQDLEDEEQGSEYKEADQEGRSRPERHKGEEAEEPCREHDLRRNDRTCRKARDTGDKKEAEEHPDEEIQAI